jgi:hypothetical protein
MGNCFAGEGYKALFMIVMINVPVFRPKSSAPRWSCVSYVLIERNIEHSVVTTASSNHAGAVAHDLNVNSKDVDCYESVRGSCPVGSPSFTIDFYLFS